MNRYNLHELEKAAKIAVESKSTQECDRARFKLSEWLEDGNNLLELIACIRAADYLRERAIVTNEAVIAYDSARLKLEWQ